MFCAARTPQRSLFAGFAGPAPGRHAAAGRLALKGRNGRSPGGPHVIPSTMLSTGGRGRTLGAVRSMASNAGSAQATCLGSKKWDKFASCVSGEWEGSTSSFASDGTVKELPENYVPSAYREWGIEVVDWTHMSSAIAGPEGLSTAVKRFMPVVGCEADAVAYVEDSTNSLRCEEGMEWEAKTITEDGAYSIGPRFLAKEGDGFMKHRIESCLQAGPEGERVRMVYDLRRTNETAPWKVMQLDVFKEEYVGEYEGGTDLRACGGAVGWGAKPRTDAAEVTSEEWKLLSGAAYSCSGDELAFMERDMPDSRTYADTTGLICLPQGMWSRTVIDGEAVFVESGWICAPESRLIVTREYQGNKLVSVTLCTETR